MHYPSHLIVFIFSICSLTATALSSVPPVLSQLAKEGAERVAASEERMVQAGEDAEAFALARQELNRAVVLTGQEGWLFGLNDVRHHAAGEFWGNRAEKVAVSARNPDPFPAITAMAEQAGNAGARLIVVPVPSKVSAYPGKLDPALEGWTDTARNGFLKMLEEEGVEVLDIAPLMSEIREEGGLSHLRTDAHWSPQAVEAVAAYIYEMVRDDDWVEDLDRQKSSFDENTTAVLGDLSEQIGGERETITVNRVALAGESVRSDRNSPIVLMGDSHGLVFGHRDLLTTRAGLGDHLAAQFGIPIDVTSVQGSGANASRTALARRGDSLEGKKLLIWVFAEREFSRSTSGWPIIPVVR